MTIKAEMSHYMTVYLTWRDRQQGSQPSWYMGDTNTCMKVIRKKHKRLAHIATDNGAHDLAAVIEGIAGVLTGEYEHKDLADKWPLAEKEIETTQWPEPLKVPFHNEQSV